MRTQKVCSIVHVIILTNDGVSGWRRQHLQARGNIGRAIPEQKITTLPEMRITVGKLLVKGRNRLNSSGDLIPAWDRRDPKFCATSPT